MTDPRVSTAGSLRTRALWSAILRAPSASEMVMTASSASEVGGDGNGETAVEGHQHRFLRAGAPRQEDEGADEENRRPPLPAEDGEALLEEVS